MVNKYCIGFTRLTPIHDYKKFADKQFSGWIFVKTTKKDTSSASNRLIFNYDRVQTVDNFMDCNMPFMLSLAEDLSVNILFDYLMPEIELYLALYPISKESV